MVSAINCERAVRDFLRGYGLSECALRWGFEPHEMEELIRFHIGAITKEADYSEFIKREIKDWDTTKPGIKGNPRSSPVCRKQPSTQG